MVTRAEIAKRSSDSFFVFGLKYIKAPAQILFTSLSKVLNSISNIPLRRRVSRDAIFAS